VRIAETMDQLTIAVAELGPNMDELFYEQFIPGDCIDYSAIVTADGPVEEVVTRAFMNGALTPPSTVEIVDEPELLAFGQHAARQLNFTGIVHMDTVKDERGQYWLLDLNLRAWGSMFACRHSDIDFGEAYLYSIGLGTQRPATHPGRTSAAVRVFPGVVYDAARSGGPMAGAKAFVRNSGIYARWLGRRYWLAQLATMLVGYRSGQR
jgi:predicted ATP-grasp superfamily ATP-dependent carboligase